MNNWRSSETCAACIWCGQCGADEICEHFSPADDLGEVTYMDDLAMRGDAYSEVVGEYSGDTPLSDRW